jgi:hypothetical protein
LASSFPVCEEIPMAKEPAKADFGPEADAAARADAGAPPAAGPFVGEQPKGDPAPAGGVEVELQRDYWPKEQPEPETDPRKPARETRIRAGERTTLPQDEVMTLLERGIATRVQK